MSSFNVASLLALMMARTLLNIYCETFFLGTGAAPAFGVLVPDAQLSLSASLSGEAGVLGIAARLPLPPSGDNEDRFLGERGDCFLEDIECDRDLDLDLDFSPL